MVEIHELILKIPGLSPDEARRFAQDVARMVAEKIPPGVESRYIDTIDLRISLPPGVSRNRMADRISTRILSQIEQ